ncbi:MAG: cyclic-di-AMP receptor [Defluviitaleaceae bacterium]|nr:cyclic-di-AMP receptor [Defluviitaleaceae bacterium]MCL2275570.1 cyclic-di-AMP receptor [Defluviitaleaceae bacterium]
MTLDKLVMAIIQDEDASYLMDVLSTKGFSITKLASTGGFLRSGNTTFICGVTDGRLPEFVEVIEKKCQSRKQIASVNAMSENESFAPQPVEVTVGGANIFILNVDQFYRI